MLEAQIRKSAIVAQQIRSEVASQPPCKMVLVHLKNDLGTHDILCRWRGELVDFERSSGPVGLQTDRQTDRQMDGQAERQTDKHIP